MTTGISIFTGGLVYPPPGTITVIQPTRDIEAVVDQDDIAATISADTGIAAVICACED